MAFVDDQLAIATDEIGDLALSYQALDDGDVYSACWFALSATDGTHFFVRQRQKLLQSLDPLSQQLATMDEYQRVAAAKHDHRRCDDCLSECGGCRERTEVMVRQCLNCGVLLGVQFAAESDAQSGSGLAPVFDGHLSGIVPTARELALRKSCEKLLKSGMGWRRRVICYSRVAPLELPRRYS
jgi:hypothetical protein